jgi:fructosamine-3-kinase
MGGLLDGVCAAIGASTGAPFRAHDVRTVSGGDVSSARVLAEGVRRYFLKLQPAQRYGMFETEAAGLAELAAADTVRVPQPVCHGVAAGQAFLVLEALTLAGNGDAAALGRQLAQLHRVSAAGFGWQRDNWIGSTPQQNGWLDHWITFWRERRLGYQLRLARDNGHRGALQRDGAVLLERLDGLFAGYRPSPSLLHGDLWGGNHGYLADGTPVLFDPAVYFGDRECDLAMAELFGGFAPAFHAAYREAWPLDPGYRARRMLYNLYHVLNHANMFGGGYAGQALRMVGALLAELR